MMETSCRVPAVQTAVALLAHPVGGNPRIHAGEGVRPHDRTGDTFRRGSSDDLGDAIRGLRALDFGAVIAPTRKQQAVMPLLDPRPTRRRSWGPSPHSATAMRCGDNIEGKCVVNTIRRTPRSGRENTWCCWVAAPRRPAVPWNCRRGRGGAHSGHRNEARAAELVAMLGGGRNCRSSVAWQGDYVVPRKQKF